MRDPEDFSGSKAEEKVLKKCEKFGFTASWNSPRKTVQDGCSYTTYPPEAEAEAETEAAAVEAEGGGALSSVLELRGGALGLGGPLHASCKVQPYRRILTVGVRDAPNHEYGGAEDAWLFVYARAHGRLVVHVLFRFLIVSWGSSTARR